MLTTEPPADPLYGSSTARAVENFPISRRPTPRPLIHAIVEIKAAAAVVNGRADASGVEPEVASAIVAAADHVLSGAEDDQFVVDVYQTGSGTSSNMNVNEVLATLAARSAGVDVHPNDDVNAGQSSNDVVPSAIRLAVLRLLTDDLVPATEELRDAFAERADALADVVKAGRTHLMDATPIMLGDEFRAYATQLDDAVERLRATYPRVGQLPLGGTATGSGIGTYPEMTTATIAELRARTGLELTEAPDHFAVQGSQDALVEVSSQLRGLAVAIYKIANDLRWLSSGPRTGLREITIPELQPGSSIMPGKVNPVLCESVMQVAATVVGHDATVAFAGSQGNLELNTFLPVMGTALIDSIELLTAVQIPFARRCVAGIEADRDVCRRHAESTPSLATALNPLIGYDAASEIVKESLRTDRTVREVALERGLADPEAIAQALDVERIARGDA